MAAPRKRRRSTERAGGSMPEFVVVAEMTISLHTRVEAENAEAALEDAGGRRTPRLCHQCAGGDPRLDWVTSGELDGEPAKLRIEEKRLSTE